MSLFQDRLSWNEIVRYIQSSTGRTVSGDGIARLLLYDDFVGMQVADHSKIYCGNVFLNDDSSFESLQFKYSDTANNDTTTVSVPAGITRPSVIKAAIFNKVVLIPTIAGQVHALVYEIPLATQYLTENLLTGSDNLPIAGWSKVGDTYTHTAGSSLTLSFDMILPAGNYILSYQINGTFAGTIGFATDELGVIVTPTSPSGLSGSYEFYTTGTGTIFSAIPSNSFNGSFDLSNITIKQIIYS